MLIDYEGKFTDLRNKADSVEIEANGLVVKNVENLTIDLNRGTNVDKQPLLDAKKEKLVLQGQVQVKQEDIKYQVTNIRNAADQIQGKVSEYEALLLSYAEEKSHLISEIERLKIELSSDTTQSQFNDVKGNLLQGRIAILSEANKGLSGIVSDRKKEAFNLKNGMENIVLDQLNRNFEIQVDVNKTQTQDLPAIIKEREDIESDLERLNSLSQRYNEMRRKLEQSGDEFEKA